MSTKTYTPLANVTLATNTNSIVFGSIPNTYRDLVIVINGSTAAAADIGLRFNGATSTYSFVSTYSTGSLVSNNNLNYPRAPIHYSTNTSLFTVNANIMDYSATDKHKTILSRGDQGTGFVVMYGSRWSDTAAITSIQIGTDSPNFNTGTIFTLYGIQG
jgi:hypothetical protein